MVMADVKVITRLMEEEEERIKDYLKSCGEKLKSKGVSAKSSFCPLPQNCDFYSLLITKRQNFRLVQIESTCRGQNKCDSKTAF